MEEKKSCKGKDGKMINEINYEYFVNHPELKEKYSAYWIITDLVCDVCGKTFSRDLKKYNSRRRERYENNYPWKDNDFCSSKCATVIAKTDYMRSANSKAQLIAQNRPEQKLKNSLGVKRSRQNPEIYKKWYDSYVSWVNSEKSNSARKKISESVKARWQDPIQREKMLNSGKFFTSCHGDFVSKHSGIIRYESSYELIFLFLMDLQNRKVKRFDIGIDYEYNNEKRIYFPDFVSDGKIYEIKSNRFMKKENGWELLVAKKEAAKIFVDQSDIYNDYEVVYEQNLNERGALDARSYIYSWLLKDGYIKNNYGGKSMIKKTDYNNDIKSRKFELAKELYKEWSLLK